MDQYSIEDQQNNNNNNLFQVTLYYFSNCEKEQLNLIILSENPNQKQESKLTSHQRYKGVYYGNLVLYSNKINLTIENNQYTIEFTEEQLQQSKKQIKIAIYQDEILFIKNNDDSQIKRRIMICSDLDGTLIGNKSHLKQFNVFWITECMFRDDLVLVYSTGRDVKEINKLIVKKSLLWPEYLVLGCGSYIYFYNHEIRQFELDPVYGSTITKDMNINELRSNFNSLPFLEELNFVPGQKKRYLQYMADAKQLKKKKNMLKLEQTQLKFEKRNIHLKIYICGDETKWLDIVSGNAGKGVALEYLVKKLGFNLKDTYTFGDSLNDTEMLLKSFGGGILVSNAEEALLEWYKNKKGEIDHLEISQHSHALAHLHKIQSLLVEQVEQIIDINDNGGNEI